MQQQAFDSYAQAYDEHFTDSLIGKTQRAQVYKHVLKYISLKQKQILEINCGTGEDALWLEKQGAKILAADASKGMIEVAKSKSNNTSIKFQELRSEHISVLSPDTFEVIFSNFGGLNCLNETELLEFKNGCTQLQKKSNQLAFVIMGTSCWWEHFYFKRKKDKIKAYRRQNAKGVDTVINGNHFKTYYYQPNHLKELFKDNYICKVVKPIGLFVPPSYLEPYFIKRKNLFSVLIELDKLFGNFSFLSNYADHYLIILQKK